MSNVIRELDRLESLEAILKKMTVPTDWCDQMMVVPKSDDKDQNIHVCVDFTRLNLAVKRERHIYLQLTMCLQKC